jgi:hypothetical protein
MVKSANRKHVVVKQEWWQQWSLDGTDKTFLPINPTLPTLSSIMRCKSTTCVQDRDE